MKSVLSTTAGFRILFLSVLAMLFTAGCCKHDDDCPAPENDDAQVTTRACSAADDPDMNKQDGPASVSYRGAEAGDDDLDGDGISDDGDDEADGEGNKKNRSSH